MFKKIRQTDHENLWNRLSRDLIYDAKQILLYCGIQIPSQHARRLCRPCLPDHQGDRIRGHPRSFYPPDSF